MKTKERFLFLDFDGVLNSDSYYRRQHERGLRCSDGFGPYFDPEAVGNLGLILQAVPKTRIVVISSWKDIHGLAGLRDMWSQRHLPGTLYSATITSLHQQLINEDLSNPAAFERVESEYKAREILTWMAANDALRDPYVIIDDAVGFPPELQPHYVRTDPNAGLTDFDAAKAIQIINKEH